MNLERNEVIKKIKASLQRRSGKAWSVTGGRGTAWGWIKVDAPPKRCTWHRREVPNPEDLCHPNYEYYEDTSKEFGYMSPADRQELATLFGLSRPVHCQGVSIAASSDYWQEYVDRADGRAPSVIGKQYWD
jgi:hypothetical protein